MRHLYVHVPFCRRRCSYCDFAIAVRREIPGQRYVDALEREWRIRFGESPLPHPPLETVYLGGGTPSLLDPALVDEFLAFIRREIGLAEGAEVTIEANPDDVTVPAVESWLRAGVNRVSLGVQSLDTRVLERMHRSHDASASLRSVAILRNAGVPSISVDLIFALPAGWSGHPLRETERILRYEPHHLSVYGLSVEPKTPLGRWVARGSVPAPDPDRFADEFQQFHGLLTRVGYEHYEVSNYARPGHRSRHNQAYWTGTDYAGIGPSAHSFLDGVRRWNIREWAAYARCLDSGRDPLAGSERPDAAQRRLERLYLGLRTDRGIRADEIGPERGGELETARRLGWLEGSHGRLRATAAGWLRLDELVGRLTTQAEGG